MIEGKNRYEAIMVDIWSSGVILYAMLCGCLPFEDPETSKLYQKILSGEYKVPKTLSEDARDMLSKILTVDPTKRFRIEDIRKHKWWSLSPQLTTSQGIIVGYHRIPIDDNMLEETVKLGFDLNFTRKCIEANRHNDATTTYYLLLKKFVREGGISKAYLGSKYFDAALIEPIRKISYDSTPAPTQATPRSTRPPPTSTPRTPPPTRTAAATPASAGRPTTSPTTSARAGAGNSSPRARSLPRGASSGSSTRPATNWATPSKSGTNAPSASRRPPTRRSPAPRRKQCTRPSTRSAGSTRRRTG